MLAALAVGDEADCNVAMIPSYMTICFITNSQGSQHSCLWPAHQPHFIVQPQLPLQPAVLDPALLLPPTACPGEHVMLDQLCCLQAAGCMLLVNHCCEQ